MPLDVGGDVLEIVQRVCDRALNVATASAKSSTHGAKAGMRALRGRTVKHLPDGEGVVKDRALKLAVEKKKRRSGPSGASNWPQGPRVARERSRAECARRAAERAAAAALREAIDALDEEVGGRTVSCTVARGVDGHHKGPTGARRRGGRLPRRVEPVCSDRGHAGARHHPRLAPCTARVSADGGSGAVR